MHRYCCQAGTYFCPESKSCGIEDSRGCSYSTRPSSSTHCRTTCNSNQPCTPDAWEYHAPNVVKRYTYAWDSSQACGCTTTGVEYACAAGYYGSADANSSNCKLCPPLIDPFGDSYARTAPIGATDISNCILPPSSYEPICPKNGKDGMYPNKLDARSFYICMYNQGYEETTGPDGTGTVLTTGFPYKYCCAAGLVFDINISACDYPGNNNNPYPTPSGDCTNQSPLFCGANKYGPIDGHCTACPDGGQTSGANFAITSCFLSADETRTDTKGTYKFSQPCYYSK